MISRETIALETYREWLACCQAQLEALRRRDWAALDLILTRKEALQARLESADAGKLADPMLNEPEKAGLMELLKKAHRLETESQELLVGQMAALSGELQTLHRRRAARQGYRPPSQETGSRYMDKRK